MRKRPDVAKHELGTRPLLCRIAHSDKLLQRWFLAPWTMKHSAMLYSFVTVGQVVRDQQHGQARGGLQSPQARRVRGRSRPGPTVSRLRSIALLFHSGDGRLWQSRNDALVQQTATVMSVEAT